MKNIDKVEKIIRVARDLSIIVAVLSITYWILFVEEESYNDPNGPYIEENIS